MTAAAPACAACIAFSTNEQLPRVRSTAAFAASGASGPQPFAGVGSTSVREDADDFDDDWHRVPRGMARYSMVDTRARRVGVATTWGQKRSQKKQKELGHTLPHARGTHQRRREGGRNTQQCSSLSHINFTRRGLPSFDLRRGRCDQQPDEYHHQAETHHRDTSPTRGGASTRERTRGVPHDHSNSKHTNTWKARTGSS